MKSRNLQIAWSMTWGVVALLLCVLWVRSYWCRDVLIVRIVGRKFIDITAKHGKLLAAKGEEDQEIPKFVKLYSYKANPTTEPQSELDMDGSSVWTGLGFKSVRWSNASGVVLPFWFFVLVSAAIAALPWMHVRFRIHTMLIATALVALALGAIVIASR